jgi:hypothetical protein
MAEPPAWSEHVREHLCSLTESFLGKARSEREIVAAGTLSFVTAHRPWALAGHSHRYDVIDLTVVSCELSNVNG